MTAAPHLTPLDPAGQHDFRLPVKKIHEGEDAAFFLTSKAYGDVLGFVLQLNAAMFPRRSRDTARASPLQTWELGSPAVAHTEQTRLVATVIQKLIDAISEAPPDPGPRRFGNVSFRKWYEIAQSRSVEWLQPSFETVSSIATETARQEVTQYLLGSFGSAQRLDFGTGHELSFIAFLAGLWKLGYFGNHTDGQQERTIVLHIIEPYVNLIRQLIKVYNLEPAGSHGVWGLDDHFFVSYIFGSAQLGPPVQDDVSIQTVPQEGSLPGAPDPGDVTRTSAVDRYRPSNMYFAAIGFIYDVKKGPFWEHSPTLYDISGVQAGWAKINKGMIKMYIAEVLSKFPVVQHFPFGYLFQWERDPAAVSPPVTAHSSSQPARAGASLTQSQTRPPGGASAGTAAPWARGAQQAPSTAAPWAQSAAAAARGTPSGPGRIPTGVSGTTRAPWANSAVGAGQVSGQAIGQIPGRVHGQAPAHDRSDTGRDPTTK